MDPKLDPRAGSARWTQHPGRTRNAGVSQMCQAGKDHPLSGANPNRSHRHRAREPERGETAANRAVLRESGRSDLNRRPFGPQPNALPDCATPRAGSDATRSGSEGAGDRTRTGFLQLGRLMCNQLHLARERTDYRFGPAIVLGRARRATRSGRRNRPCRRRRSPARSTASRRRTLRRRRGNCR